MQQTVLIISRFSCLPCKLACTVVRDEQVDVRDIRCPKCNGETIEGADTVSARRC
jgi:predicted Zn-ribbon and HTH transcriptional regulator